MLAISRSLMMQPKLLVLDEPTLGLAPVILEQLSNAMERLRRTTLITVLLGEQNVTFGVPRADRVYVLEHTRIDWKSDPLRFATEKVSLKTTERAALGPVVKCSNGPLGA
jgi:branched-chain amino acid transport system ATP-binding protein